MVKPKHAKRTGQSREAAQVAGRLIGTKIVGLYPQLRPAERRVADYLLAHPHEVTGLPIATLAKRCSVSQHTVTRFCRSIGSLGYPQLKMALAQHLVLAASSLSEQGEPPSGPEGIIAQAFQFNISSLRATLALEQTEALRAVTNLIARSRRVRWFGVGGSAVVCQDAALRLKQLGVEAEAVSDPYSQAVEACWLGKRDLAVGVSHTGESRAVVEALLLARESGATTAAITNFPHSSLGKAVNHLLLTATDPPQAGASATAVVSRLAQLALVDVLCALAAVERTQQVGEPIDRIDAYVEANLRIGRKPRIVQR